ncbi:ribosomal protein S5 domain 2-like protein [Anaeromyces robustus]|uniref:Ribosomal protein S5 domain 2-like protein n=1 Tax=Anaeromyces robustus TaxID=1754192 RepID=A0A1Y1XM31_9FUNG|nr:ribosomal protein S5 domain 2-like protein [Anaeromyces robustus]|eukprot:ORX86755.1 ribosomal protein S5 domain 2-like protein [Anaeromyces robustus]
MDKRRINGPEISVKPIEKKSTQPKNNKDDGIRKNNRSVDNIRPIFIKPNVIKKANGSAYYEAENIKIICGVYGPRSSKRSMVSDEGTIYCEFKFAPFSCNKRCGYIRNAQEREYSLIIQQAFLPAIRLNLYPKSSIDIYVTVLENDGTTACLAAAITCISIALTDAGIQMYDLVAAASATCIKGNICLDPDASEENDTNSKFMLSYMPSLKQVTHVLCTGKMEAEQSIEAIGICIDACNSIKTVMDHCLINSH